MSSVNPTEIENADAIIFDSVVIESKDFQPTEIAATVTNLDVFEHLDKPYITAILGFIDMEDVVGTLRLTGGEKVTIRLKGNQEDFFPVIKVFYIDKVLSSSKIAEHEEFFTFHLIEDHAFISNTKNVNQVYSGKSSEIVNKIGLDYLGRSVDSKANDLQQTKVIVPNLSPIDAMCWIKNRTTTTDGYPFYLYSTFINPYGDLSFYDLKTMLTAPAMNENKPYTYYESQISSEDQTSKRRVIIAAEARDTSDVYALIDEGLIGSEYRYLDITKNTKDKDQKDKRDNKFTFDVDREVIKKLKDEDIIKTHPIYQSSKHEWADEKISSRKISRIGSTQAFDGIKSLSERGNAGEYRLNEVARSMNKLLTTNPMSFIVNGIDFFNGLDNATIGNKLYVQFIRNLVPESVDIPFDFNKSGKYLIFACKHSFTPREYTLTFSGVKMSNDNEIV